MKPIFPEKLRPGDTIGLVGIAGPAELGILNRAKELLRRIGLDVITGQCCRRRHGYFSGTDESRARELNEMFADPDIRGILAMRGGYGCARIADKIDLDIVRASPKLFCGYSDITYLHLLFNQQCGLVTYHTPMPTTEIYKGLDEYSMEYYKRALFYDGDFGELLNPKNQSLQTLVPGYAEGILIGGNLSIVVSTIGTSAEIDCEGKILFLEDVDEDVYSIDRMLCQLRNSGKLSAAKGIILGGFTNCVADKNGLSLDEVFGELIIPEGKPSICRLALGHCMPTASVPLGAMVSLDATERRIVFGS